MKMIRSILAASMLLLSSLAIAVLFALISPTLYAGASAEWPVSIEFDTADSGRAFGLMWTVRSSRNDVEGIGCSYRSNVEKVEWEHFPWDHPVNNWAWCQAQDAGGVQVWCFTENQHLLDALQAISPFSFLRFGFVNLEDVPGFGLVGECTSLDFSTQSLHLPLFSTKK